MEELTEVPSAIDATIATTGLTMQRTLPSLAVKVVFFGGILGKHGRAGLPLEGYSTLISYSNEQLPPTRSSSRLKKGGALPSKKK